MTCKTPSNFVILFSFVLFCSLVFLKQSGWSLESSSMQLHVSGFLWALSNLFYIEIHFYGICFLESWPPCHFLFNLRRRQSFIQTPSGCVTNRDFSSPNPDSLIHILWKLYKLGIPSTKITGYFAKCFTLSVPATQKLGEISQWKQLLLQPRFSFCFFQRIYGNQNNLAKSLAKTI